MFILTLNLFVFQVLSEELVSKGALTSLLKHSLIKSVTPQRRVTRTLHSVALDDDDEDAEVQLDDSDDDVDGDGSDHRDDGEGFERWTRGRRSLAFGVDLHLPKKYLNSSLIFLQRQTYGAEARLESCSVVNICLMFIFKLYW